MASSKRKNIIGVCHRGAPAMRSVLCALSIVVLAAAAAGQDVNTNSSTNQLSGQTVTNNAASAESVETPALPPPVIEQLQEQNPATNLLNVAPVELPLTGPRTVGSPNLTSPLLGTSVFGAPPSPPAGTFPPTAGIPVYGPIDVHPSLLYSFTFGNGIESQPGVGSKTAVNTISPTLLFDLGSHWKLDYAPSYAVYSSSLFHSTLNESVVLTGATTYEDWAFNFSQSYVDSDTPLIETGTQTSQEAYSTALAAAYQFNGKLSLQLGANQNFLFASEFQTTRSWTGNSGLNYQFMPEFGMGISLGGGYDDLSEGSSTPFETLQATMNFHPGPKLSVTLSGGAEELQFVNPSAPSLLTPIYSGSVHYQIFSGTSISASANRSETPSFFGNQVEVSTAIGATFQQQLSKKISFGLNAGYSTEPLTAIVPGPLPQYFFGAPPRTSLTEDENNTTTTFGASLNYAIISRGNISVFYSYNKNSASQNNYSYLSHQIGFTLSYRY